jgi:hypothetical protein
MSAINWSEIAEQCHPSIGSQRRGVLKISLFGFQILFVPDEERTRVEREVAAGGMTIHGTASQTIDSGEKLFVAVVKADSLEKLRAIAHSLGGH